MFENIRTALRKNNEEGYVYSVAKWITLLMVVGILLYQLTGGWGTLVCLSLAIALLIGRFLLARQAEGDFRDMHHAKQGYTKSRKKDYLRFIKARGEQMLNDNKMLTKRAKKEINELLAYANDRL